MKKSSAIILGTALLCTAFSGSAFAMSQDERDNSPSLFQFIAQNQVSGVVQMNTAPVTEQPSTAATETETVTEEDAAVPATTTETETSKEAESDQSTSATTAQNAVVLQPTNPNNVSIIIAPPAKDDNK